MSFISGSGGSVFGPAAPQPSPGNSPGRSLLQLAGLVTNIPLINGTQNFLSVPVPNDQTPHLLFVVGFVTVTTTEIGGNINMSFTVSGTPTIALLQAGGAAVGGTEFSQQGPYFVDPGQVITPKQSAALTGGAATATVAVYLA